MIVELTRIRMALATVESLLEEALNQAREINEKYKLLLIEHLQVLNKLDEYVRQNSNNKESTLGVPEVST